jgi:hypothetical protein
MKLCNEAQEEGRSPNLTGALDDDLEVDVAPVDDGDVAPIGLTAGQREAQEEEEEEVVVVVVGRGDK